MRPVQYEFVSHWLIDTDIVTAEQTITDLHHWSDWWEGLEALEVTGAAPDNVGTEMTCIWRSDSGYRLKLLVRVTEHIIGKRMTFTSSGDLSGSGDCRFESVSDEQTAITITWNVATTKSWMNMLAPLLRPTFVKNHHRLMKKGERGLNRYIKTTDAVHPKLETNRS